MVSCYQTAWGRVDVFGQRQFTRHQPSCKMPRFKATPKRGYSAHQESNSKSGDEFSSGEMNDTLLQNEDKRKRERVLRKLVSIARKFAGKLTGVSARSVRNVDTAIILAQAAAFAAFAGGSSTPSPQTAHPPIAPLGLSLEKLLIPQPPASTSEQATLKKTSTATQTTDHCKSETAVPLHAPESNESTPPPKSNSLSETHTVVAVPAQVVQDSSESPNSVFIIPLAPPDYDPQNPLGRRKIPEVTECSVCHKMMRRGSLREHMEMHNKSGKFKCDVCQKTFSRASAREKHIRTHTGEKPFVCEYCSKAYRQRVHLNEHLRSHTGIRPFVCRLCGFSLASKSLLNRHLGTHGVNLQLPDAPDLWFKSDAPKETVLSLAAEAGRVLSVVNLEAGNGIPNGISAPTHPSSITKERVEAAKKPISKDVILSGRKHLCSACPAGFPTVQALRSHRLTTHGVQFPHKCPQCEKSFSSIKLRKIHLRTQHPQVCTICSEVMPQRNLYYLHAHMRQAHPDYVIAKTGTRSSVRLSSKARRGDAKRSATMSEEDTLRKWKHFKEGDPASGSSDADCESASSSNHSYSSSNGSDPQVPVEPEATKTGSAECLSTEISEDIQSAEGRDVALDVVTPETENETLSNPIMPGQVLMTADSDPNKVTRTDDAAQLALLGDGFGSGRSSSAIDAVITDGVDTVVRVKREMLPAKAEAP